MYNFSMKMRLNKFLALSGIASRRKCDLLIEQGRIFVNKKQVSELGEKIDPDLDIVEFDGKKVNLKKSVYILLNKPEGFLCSCAKRNLSEKTILDLIDVKERIFPVGRLDKNSSGLIILTNDGELALKLTHPSFEKEKEYEVLVNKKITLEFLQSMERGVVIENDYKTRKTKLKKISDKSFSIILKEGKKRQIRQMCQALGYFVVKLKRTRIGKLKLANLKVGEWKKISREDIV